MDIKLKWKEKFLERYSKLTDINKFKKYSSTFLRRSMRVNTLKISNKELKLRLKDWKLKQIPWCEDGYFIEHKAKERRDIGNLPEHSLGYFYVQEAVSMIPALALAPKEDDIILDMCAAPGSKTTQLSSLMNNKGIIIANDFDYSRLKALTINLQRCGCLNTIITLSDARFIKGSYDKILLDAPCSGTGTIRKSTKTPEIWNPNMIKKLSSIQKHLINTAFNLLKKNGTLVYSTCSLEPEENEEVIDYLLNKYEVKIEKIKLNGLKSSPPILKFEDKVYSSKIKNCLRIWPQDNNTEGFFVAKIKKI